MKATRNTDDTLRKQESKRADQRESKKERQRDLEIQKDILQNQKKSEQIKKIVSIQRVSGLRDEKQLAMLEKLLLEEYDDNYDIIMDRIFGDHFYQAEEENEKEIKAYLNAVEDEFEGRENPPNSSQDKTLQEDKDIGLIPRPNIPTIFKHKVTTEEAQRLQEQTQLALWWLCDNCQ